MATIVIAEDNRFARKLLQRYASKTGHTIIACEDGAIALEQIRKEQPDLVLTDLLMPNLDGLELLEALSKEFPGIPCGVLSADIQASTREKVESYGVIGFINKPYTEQQVIDVVTDVLGQAEAT